MTAPGNDADTAKPPRRHTGDRLRGLGLWWTFAAALVLGIAVVIAIAQNSHGVRVHYIVWHANVPLIVVVLTTALIAILLDEAGGLIWRHRRRARIGRRSELAQLRTERHAPAEAPASASAPARPAEVVPEPARL
jgi:uncharacterized integral membrane protein